MVYCKTVGVIREVSMGFWFQRGWRLVSEGSQTVNSHVNNPGSVAFM